MPKREISSEDILQSEYFSQAVIVEPNARLLFISGMTPKGPDGSTVGIGDVEAQTRQVCENIKIVIEAAGGTLEDICRLDVYVRNIEHRHLIYNVRKEYFRSPLPSSTMVEVAKFVSPDYLVEITAVGAVHF